MKRILMLASLLAAGMPLGAQNLVKEKFEQTAKFKEIIVTEMAGLATVYAGDGGIIAAV